MFLLIDGIVNIIKMAKNSPSHLPAFEMYLIVFLMYPKIVHSILVHCTVLYSGTVPNTGTDPSGLPWP